MRLFCCIQLKTNKQREAKASLAKAPETREADSSIFGTSEKERIKVLRVKVAVTVTVMVMVTVTDTV